MSNLHDGQVVRPGFENQGRRQVAWNACAHGRTTIFGCCISPAAVAVDSECDDSLDDMDDEQVADVEDESSTSMDDSRAC